MHVMAIYIHQLKDWPQFFWEESLLSKQLAQIRHQQGRLLGRMEALGFNLQEEASLQTLTLDVLKSSEIEGELLDTEQIRSSIARKLGMDIAGLIPSERDVDGIVEMILDATQKYTATLTEDRLFGWHSSLFPTGRSGLYKIVVGAWRTNVKEDPMQVISGAMGKEKIHYQAPDAEILPDEMGAFIDWFNSEINVDPVIKAAIAHLWFVTIHPFDDGNGRIARALADMQLTRSDASKQRFYSMSAQIRKERNTYYAMLEKTQKNSLNITTWLEWFLSCLGRALTASELSLAGILYKAKFWENHVNTMLNIRQKKMLNKLLDGFEGVLNSSKWAKINKCSSDTAVRDINDLIDKSILKKEEAGGRSTGYSLV
jgi:Fic family protein